MTKKTNKSKNKLSSTPFVSICTPTFNRRHFIPYIIKCFEHQTYPKDRMEWIIVDDGTDKIEDIVAHIPQVKYFKYDTKMTLGKKRNLCHDFATGEILVYMDDDDYYPPERVSHAVETLRKNPKALCAGASIMHIFFKHINTMYRFGPYGPNHATAATFAFRRELLNTTSFQEEACVAEERHFLKSYTVPFVQLDAMKTILVFSHDHNSFDKKILLEGPPNHVTNISDKTPADFVKEKDILQFFMHDIDHLLNAYDPGDPKHKPDVLKQLSEIKKSREEMAKKEMERHETIQKIQNAQNAQNAQTQNSVQEAQNKQAMQLIQNKFNEFSGTIKNLSTENSELKEKIKYLENKIQALLTEKTEESQIEENKN
jgi:glycosyltransferase involved in cell wall biosynthesis